VNTITLWHYLEDIWRVPYLGSYHPRERHLSYCAAGRRIQYEFPGLMEDVVRATGIMTTGKVGRGGAGLIRAREFRRFLEVIMTDNPYCFVVRPPDRFSDNFAIDALQKAAAMLRAWTRERGGENTINQPSWPEAKDDAIVREDCPAFAGRFDAGGSPVPLCKANDRHPELFRYGGIFNRFGRTTCGRCSWHTNYPPLPS
jgi:hypothetical protein